MRYDRPRLIPEEYYTNPPANKIVYSSPRVGAFGRTNYGYPSAITLLGDRQ